MKIEGVVLFRDVSQRQTIVSKHQICYVFRGPTTTSELGIFISFRRRISAFRTERISRL